MQLINVKSVIMAPNGGEIEYYQDGALAYRVTVPRGRFRGSEYLVEGYQAYADAIMTVIQPASAVFVNRSLAKLDTSANADFIPSRARVGEYEAAMVRKLKTDLQEVSALKAQIRADKALAAVTTPAPDPDPVIEKEDGKP